MYIDLIFVDTFSPSQLFYSYVTIIFHLLELNQDYA